MLKLRMEKATAFKTLLSAIATICDEVTLKFTADGFSGRSMDPSRVAMYDLTLSKEFFDEYECSPETTLCFNLTDFMKLLRTSRSHKLEISVDETSINKLNIVFSKGVNTRRFTFPLLEAPEPEVPTPKVTFVSKVKATASTLTSAVEDVALVSDAVTIKATSDTLFLSARGDLMTADIQLAKDSEDILVLETREEAEAHFSLSYLTDVLKSGSNLIDLVELELAKDMPLKLKFEMHDGTLCFYVAPRIMTD